MNTIHGVPFYLQPNGIHDLWFPVIQSGTTWNVDIHCPAAARTARPNTSSIDHRDRRWRGRRDQMLRLSRHSTLHHDSFRYIVDLSETHGRFLS